jgi:hypothetical protein
MFATLYCGLYTHLNTYGPMITVPTLLLIIGLTPPHNCELSRNQLLDVASVTECAKGFSSSLTPNSAALIDGIDQRVR